MARRRRQAPGRGSPHVRRGRHRAARARPDSARLTLAPSATRVDAADLVATAAATSTLDELDQAFAARGVWIALDPPGARAGTLGDALANGAGGPLAASFGPPRDQVIGLTFVAGDGRTVHTGGRVVKNVAGFDLAKLVVGGRGAFGRITEAHLRLRARAEADRTRGWSGARADVERATARLLLGGAMLAACEVLSPDLAAALGLEPRWTLLARSSGTGAGVDAELAAAAAAVTPCDEIAVGQTIWDGWRAAVGDWPARARVGADPSRWGEAAALAEHAGASACSITVPRGTVRTRFAGGADALRSLRADAASRGWPMTLEHADAETERAVGIWGAIPEGSLRIARALRAALGPEGTQNVPLWIETGA